MMKMMSSIKYSHSLEDFEIRFVCQIAASIQINKQYSLRCEAAPPEIDTKNTSFEIINGGDVY